MIVVLNEWIFHDLWGENGEGNQRETFEFLLAFERSNDVFVVPRESRWLGKANGLMAYSDPLRRSISRRFRSLFINRERALWVWSEENTSIPAELLDQLPEEDVYLVSAYLAADANVLVTTDVDLHDALVNAESVVCRMRDDFLEDYLA